MPELPEVETVRRTLAPVVEGRTIAVASFTWPRTCAGDPRATETCLAGQHIERLERYGKYLLFRLRKDGRDSLLVIHLRMTGNLLVNGARGEHTRANMTLDDGTAVVFPRRPQVRALAVVRAAAGAPGRAGPRAAGNRTRRVRHPTAVAPRAAQGAAARPGVPARPGQHLRRRSAVPGPPASAPQRGWRRAAQGARPARSDTGRAAQRHRRRRHEHPRLPRQPRRRGRLPTPDPHLRQGRQAVRELRNAGAPDPRGAAGHPLLPALPAAVTTVAKGGVHRRRGARSRRVTAIVSPCKSSTMLKAMRWTLTGCGGAAP